MVYSGTIFLQIHNDVAVNTVLVAFLSGNDGDRLS